MRVAIYARVSTLDKGQDPENQLRELRAWCANSRHTISREYVERESGRKGADKRKQFAALFEDAAKRKFDCVLFWALDRFSREGMAQTIVHLQRLTSYGVTFHSYTEPHLATDNELVRNILLALLSSLAKVEAQKISERTKAGMARAKAKGVKVGRPRIELRQKIVQRSAKGDTPYAIDPGHRPALGRVKTKSNLVAALSGGGIFCIFCSERDHKPQNSGCGYTA
jgi:DNA invertase Pin-like site-specific DNA recombinase